MNIITSGQPLQEAAKALIMVHGRGAGAQDILSLAPYLPLQNYALLAPQAETYTWYPYSFMVAPAQNEPSLSAALQTLKETTASALEAGIPASQIYFLGFSQGACLTLEYVTRNAQRYGGVVAFTGGLIGDKIYKENYTGDFGGTPVFIGSSDPDMHVPAARVKETEQVMKEMGADITVKLYPNMGHTVSQDEMDVATKLIFNK